MPCMMVRRVRGSCGLQGKCWTFCGLSAYVDTVNHGENSKEHQRLMSTAKPLFSGSNPDAASRH